MVVFSDRQQQERAQQTLEAIRRQGRWEGSLVWVAINFEPPRDFVREWDIEILIRPALHVQWLLDLRRIYPFHGTDGRETQKLIQFSKLRVLDPFFTRWRSMLYLDAGMHIANPIAPIFSIPHAGRFVAPDDRYPFDDPNKTFFAQWDQEAMPDRFQDLAARYEDNAYFLNCMWLMDTSLITSSLLREFMSLLRRYPISRTNEMAIMNLYLRPIWTPLPELVAVDDNKTMLRVFDWSERHGRRTRDYILLKYSRNILD